MAGTTEPVVASLTKTGAAFQYLRRAIEAGRFPPGHRLRITSLITELGMSPTPIREALRLLEAEGLVVNEPHHGMVVREYDVGEIDDVYRMRVLLEPVATKMAVQNMQPAQLRQLLRIHKQFIAAAGADHPSTAALNDNWHGALYAAAASPLLNEFVTRLWRALPARAMWSSSRSEESSAAHAAIMAAVERGDATLAGDLMKAHIEAGWAANTERMRHALAKK